MLRVWLLKSGLVECCFCSVVSFVVEDGWMDLLVAILRGRSVCQGWDVWMTRLREMYNVAQREGRRNAGELSG